MKWKATLIKYRDADRIAIEFEKDPELIRRIKLIEDARWNPAKKYWHIPDTSINRTRFKLVQKQETELSAEGQEHLGQFIRWLSAKRYSINTIKTYSESLRLFLIYFRTKAVSEISNADVLDFNHDYILKNKFSASYQNQITSAVKLYFRTIRNTNIEWIK